MIALKKEGFWAVDSGDKYGTSEEQKTQIKVSRELHGEEMKGAGSGKSLDTTAVGVRTLLVPLPLRWIVFLIASSEATTRFGNRFLSKYSGARPRVPVTRRTAKCSDHNTAQR